MNHVVKLRDRQVRVADQRVADLVALGFRDILDPLLVVTDGIDAEPDNLRVALIEFWLEAR